MRREWISAATDELPSLPRPERPQFEIQMLCGERDALMGMWSSFSFCRYLDGAGFVLHSDGTIANDTLTRWRRLLPGMRVLSREETYSAMDVGLAAYPRMIKWSREYHFGLKLGGFSVAAHRDRSLELDSDVLCLSQPIELVESLTTDEWRFGWNRHERRSHYAYSEALLREVLGDDLMGPLPPRFNTGLFSFRRFDVAQMQRLEDVLARLEADERIDPLRFWMQQTLFGILVSKEAAARPFPAAYDIHNGPTRASSLVRHYVGVPGVRPRFFTEGVPAMIRDARRRGHLPADFCRDCV